MGPAGARDRHRHHGDQPTGHSAVRLCASALCGPGVTQTSQDSIPWLGTLRARGGLGFGRVLLLGACGYGYGVFKSTQTLTTTLASVTSTTAEKRAAWVAGGGIEAALTAQWTVKFEYLHLDSGNQNTTYSMAGVGLVTAQNRMTEDVLRFGANYRF